MYVIANESRVTFSLSIHLHARGPAQKISLLSGQEDGLLFWHAWMQHCLFNGNMSSIRTLNFCFASIKPL